VRTAGIERIVPSSIRKRFVTFQNGVVCVAIATLRGYSENLYLHNSN
jgi:hypothetical protein